MPPELEHVVKAVKMLEAHDCWLHRALVHMTAAILVMETRIGPPPEQSDPVPSPPTTVEES